MIRLEKISRNRSVEIFFETLIVDTVEGVPVVEFPIGRGDRAVEGARLEIVCTPNKGTEGSNPSLSASKKARRADGCCSEFGSPNAPRTPGMSIADS